jgi:hypothetical protein
VRDNGRAGTTDRKRQFRRQIDVRNTTNAVGTE